MKVLEMSEGGNAGMGGSPGCKDDHPPAVNTFPSDQTHPLVLHQT